jgi:hypothetical protein
LKSCGPARADNCSLFHTTENGQRLVVGDAAVAAGYADDDAVVLVGAVEDGFGFLYLLGRDDGDQADGPLFEQAKKKIAQLDGFEIVHALRHKNKDADRLANQAMDRGMGR